MFEISRANMKWLEENYKKLRREFRDQWVIIRDKKVVETAETFDEIMKALKRYDVNRVLVEYIRSERVAMFF